MAAIEFALVAPILLTLMFSTIVYALYFCVYLGVHEAASEGARAAVTGLGTPERTALAVDRARDVIAAYAPLTGAAPAVVEAEPVATGIFRVRVSYDIGDSAIMNYGSLLPMPNSVITSEVVVSNGSY